MPSSKRDVGDPRALCAEIHSDDGIDPRKDKKCRSDQTKKHDRKVQQLCKQVQNALQLVLPSLDALVDATVVGVVPAPNTGRLRVTLTVPATVDPQHMVEQLKRSNGYLRCEVGQAVARRRVPELMFSIISEGASDE